MPLHLEYRPQNLEEFFGNKSLKAGLASILKRKDKPKAYLIAGETGCGKTTLARIIAISLGCDMEHDYYEWDIGDARGIDDARNMKKNLSYAPFGGKVKVIVLDECQGATPDFKDSMLKVLEEPPKHVVFIICTTDPDKLVSRSGKQTIETRTTRFDVQPLNKQDMRDLILSVLSREGIEKDYPSEIIEEIIKSADGKARLAINILDQIIDMNDLDEILDITRRMGDTEANIRDFCQALLYKNWIDCHKQLTRMAVEKKDAEKIRRAVLSYMQKVILGNNSKLYYSAYMVIKNFEGNFYDSGMAGLVAASFLTTTRPELKDIPY